MPKYCKKPVVADTHNFIICGQISSGKDTLAALIPGIKLAFADELKIICRLIRTDIVQAADYARVLFGSHRPCNLMSKLAEFSQYPVETKDRALVRDFGNWARKHYPLIWVDSVKRKIKPENQYVITDARFAHEILGFPEFISIYIEVPEETRKYRALLRDKNLFEEQFRHKTELDISLLKPMCNFIINNNGTKDELKYQVNQILRFIKGERM